MVLHVAYKFSTEFCYQNLLLSYYIIYIDLTFNIIIIIINHYINIFLKMYYVLIT